LTTFREMPVVGLAVMDPVEVGQETVGPGVLRETATTQDGVGVVHRRVPREEVRCMLVVPSIAALMATDSPCRVRRSSFTGKCPQ
jgi:hypothetical protein